MQKHGIIGEDSKLDPCQITVCYNYKKHLTNFDWQNCDSGQLHFHNGRYIDNGQLHIYGFIEINSDVSYYNRLKIYIEITCIND